MIIYKITNKTNEKNYIGLTTRTLNERKIEHLSDSRCGSECAIHRAIRKYGEESFIWEVIDESDNAHELNEKEIYWIEKYDSYNTGYNENKGGSVYYHGENHPMYGKHGEDNPNSIPIIQFSLDGEFIGKHASSTEGAKIVGGNRGNITSCCKGNLTHIYDSIWIYESEYKEELVKERVDIYRKKELRNSIVQLTKDGEFVQDYLTARDGAKAVDGYGSAITACCKLKPKYKTYKGFMWMYKSDYDNEEVRNEIIERNKKRW